MRGQVPARAIDQLVELGMQPERTPAVIEEAEAEPASVEHRDQCVESRHHPARLDPLHGLAPHLCQLGELALADHPVVPDRAQHPPRHRSEVG